LGATLSVELHLLVLGELLEPGRRDRREVSEEIGRAVIGSDEAEALLRVEPFHSASGHVFSSSCFIAVETAVSAAPERPTGTIPVGRVRVGRSQAPGPAREPRGAMVTVARG